ALAATGALFPLIAPVIGWIGVFLTGSVVNNNTLFAPLQVATAEGIGSDPALFVGAHTAGGDAAKAISPQSIAIAAGAVGLSGRESDILRASILDSLGILAVICVWNLVLSLVLTGGTRTWSGRSAGDPTGADTREPSWPRGPGPRRTGAGAAGDLHSEP